MRVKWTKELLQKVQELRDKNMGLHDIASELGVTYSQVEQAIKRYNIEGGNVNSIISEKKMRQILSSRGYKVEKVEEVSLWRSPSMDELQTCLSIVLRSVPFPINVTS